VNLPNCRTMKNVELVPFESVHLDQFDDIEGELIFLGAAFKATLEDTDTDGPGFTGIYKDEIIGCGGVRLFWAGVGEAWGFYPQRFFRYTKEVFWYTKTMLNKIIMQFSLRRVQATARVDYPEAQNWLRHLGFRIEGRMKNYCPCGQDTFLYAITR